MLLSEEKVNDRVCFIIGVESYVARWWTAGVVATVINNCH